MTQQATQPDSGRASNGQFLPGHLLSAKSPIYTQSPRSIKAAIESYLTHCNSNDQSPTIPGLALALGFSSREAFWQFLNKSETLGQANSNDRQAIFNAVNKVRMAIEGIRVQRLVDRCHYVDAAPRSECVWVGGSLHSPADREIPRHR